MAIIARIQDGSYTPSTRINCQSSFQVSTLNGHQQQAIAQSLSGKSCNHTHDASTLKLLAVEHLV
jgi:hypothetical protein